MIQWRKQNDVLGTINRGNPTESGLCTLCRADCQGKCETWLSSLLGRNLLYPRDFGHVTAGSGNIVHVGVGYHSLRIQGRLYGGSRDQGKDNGESGAFTKVNVESAFGSAVKTKVRAPIVSGALGSTFVAARFWEPLAVGAALAGIPIVVGENVVGVDREAVFENGKVKHSPELDRRVSVFLRYYDGYGVVIVQMNVEDSRNGVAEYLINRYGDKVAIELKWGQGAKDIGGEIQVTSYDYALFLKRRGYILDPDPEAPGVREAFEHGQIKAFARHSRLGYVEQSSAAEVAEQFFRQVEYLRQLGYKRITLKTGAYGMEALALAIRLASEAGLDLLTIDGAGGGTGMSPWNMMEHWGVPSLLLHAKAYEFAKRLADRGMPVVDLAFGGGLAREDHIFKALALGAPFAKLVCMGRALMIPAFLGTNIEGVLRPERRIAGGQQLGYWEKLPPNVREIGDKPEELFACYYEVERKVGSAEIKNIPFGAIALYTFVDKLMAGLQQLLAGARKFSVTEISRDDIVSANRETAAEIGIPFVTDAESDRALQILDGQFSGAVVGSKRF
ncbi:MAG: glutamate synthase-related protein [Thermoguttaceae bacterium]|nr:glutamate synthase-related protein [Thermoguttaceae bacterium]MDW8079892.1 glutamate synthase-related protein [Thermoguttaceae bacterium]